MITDEQRERNKADFRMHLAALSEGFCPLQGDPLRPDSASPKDPGDILAWCDCGHWRYDALLDEIHYQGPRWPALYRGEL